MPRTIAEALPGFVEPSHDWFRTPEHRHRLRKCQASVCREPDTFVISRRRAIHADIPTVRQRISGMIECCLWRSLDRTMQPRRRPPEHYARTASTGGEWMSTYCRFAIPWRPTRDPLRRRVRDRGITDLIPAVLGGPLHGLTYQA